MRKQLLKNLMTTIFILVVSILHAQTPNLIWTDEFSGTSLDLTKWQPQIGDGCAEGICGWGNNELQYYKAENAVVSNGMLSIIAKRERVQAKAYTSARIRTKNLADFSYGRFEARIKLPAGAGLWPAFWMLSTNEPFGGWPQSGEIDIMEFISAKPDHVFGTIHYGDAYPNNKFQGNDFYLYDGSKFSDAFHEFAIEWIPGEIRWYVDNILYSVKRKADVSPYNWPFDNNNFHFILNTAVGGNLGGTVDNTIFPATMQVDYVRVYDGPKPTIRGQRVVSNAATGIKYNVDKISTSVNVTWTVPSGATITAGQGTSEVTVNFGSSSGNVTATFNPGTGSQTLPIDVIVEPSYSKGFSFENFDAAGSATYLSSDGILTEVANPAPNTVNSSAIVGRYVRNSQKQYDVLFYNTSAIADASQYAKVAPDKKFYVDVYTSAPIGTEIILQLETSTATATNYPTGRHSRYKATITQNGSWHRLPFSYSDKPDAGASVSIAKMAILFNSNTLTGDTYFFDNLDSYNAGTGGTTNQPPTVGITSPANGSSYLESTSIAVAASASDSDGSVTQVQFFANGASIGIDTSSPYSVNWIVPAGTNTLTAVATDNAGATTTSTSVSVTGTTQSGTATTMFVSSVVTGTANAGGGKKYGTATVTIINNLGNAVSGAVVSGTFSGTFNEAASGTTNSNGQVTLQTTASAKGTVTVNFCVNNVTGSLVYDASLNGSGSFACTSGSSSRIRSPLANGQQVMPSENISFRMYPNPVQDRLYLTLDGFEENVAVVIINMNGQILMSAKQKVESFDVSALHSGLYLLKVTDGKTTIMQKFVK